MFFLVSTILGLFGSSTIPEALRIKAMNFFNYTTIITLFDSEKILSGGTYIYGLLILLGIAIITYIIGIIRFDKKIYHYNYENSNVNWSFYNNLH